MIVGVRVNDAPTLHETVDDHDPSVIHISVLLKEGSLNPGANSLKVDLVKPHLLRCLSARPVALSVAAIVIICSLLLVITCGFKSGDRRASDASPSCAEEDIASALKGGPLDPSSMDIEVLGAGLSLSRNQDASAVGKKVRVGFMSALNQLYDGGAPMNNPTVCPLNADLADMSAATLISAYRQMWSFMRTFSSMSSDFLARFELSVRAMKRAGGRNVRSVVREHSLVFPVFPKLCTLKLRVGNYQDGGKVICGQSLAEAPSCNVFSLGSNDDFSFESALSASTRCNVATFDCSSFPPKKTFPRHAFFPKCIGSYNAKVVYRKKRPNGRFRNMRAMDYWTLDEALKYSKFSSLNYLKMDIEGAEHTVLGELLGKLHPNKWPSQVSVELHVGMFNHTAAETIELYRSMFLNGYLLVYKEDNPACVPCAEMLFVRTFC
jgi:hypothetical protein